MPNKLNQWIKAVIVLMIAVALAFAYFMVRYFVADREPSATQAPAKTQMPAESQAPQVLNQDDLSPDTKAWFQVHDGDLYDANGARLALSDLYGQPLVLCFWSSWCPDCDLYEERLNDIAQAVEAEGGRFALICREGVRGETVESALTKLEEKQLYMENYFDRGAALFAQLGLRQVPSLAFISPKGVLMAASSEQLNDRTVASYVRYAAGGAKAQILNFLNGDVQTDGVAVPFSYILNSQGKLLKSDVVLSETMGLYLEYALRERDRALFERIQKYIDGNLFSDGLFAWRTQKGKKAEANATVDDLRIFRCRVDESEVWPMFTQELSVYENALYRKTVKDGTLRDFFDWKQEDAGSTLTLCYIDLEALERLTEYNKRWRFVEERSAEILKNGLISDAFPLYHPRYDYSLAAYTGERLQMNEAMVTVLNAVRAGVAEEKTLDYLENMLENGPIYAAYTLEGQMDQGYDYESTATYALLVQIAMESGRQEMALNALRKMEALRVFDPQYGIEGSYGRAFSIRVYTFDVLQALLAWQMMEPALQYY